MTRIHPATSIGAVHLTVRGLDRMVEFYARGIGLTELGRDGAIVRLGAGRRTLVVLHHDPAAQPAGRTTGLYHLAIRVPSRADLAQVARHLVGAGVPLHGASDHLVSEALYLADVEGNGIEIYRDRDRAEWPRQADGSIAMATEALDAQALYDEGRDAPDWRMPDGTVMGHVHLRVSDVAAAEKFYVDTLGFDLMARYGDAASFVAAGGYHHHIGFNMWDSAGAPPPAADAAGLKYVEVELPDAEALAAVLGSAVTAGLLGHTADGALVRDPSGNLLLPRRVASPN